LWIVDGARVGIDIRNGVFLSVVILIWAVQVLSKLKILGYLHVIASIIFMSWLSIDFLKNIYLVSGLLITLVFQIILLIKPTLKRSITTYANLSITMLLGGLWHGASVNFIIWGALHGGALALHKFYMDITGTKNATQKGFRKLVGQIITFHFVCFCWIFFRATDTEKVGKILYQIFYSFNGQIFIQVLQGYSLVIGLLVIGFLVHWLPKHWKITYQNLFGKMPDMIKALIIAIVIVILYQANTGYQPFIYFQF
jgi:D-alanyl-lipoteichoic acid acyltransferase DltB (MBOAT superfamily)